MCSAPCLCFRIIFERFSSKDPNSKDNSVGIQLLGIVMANNLPPYDPQCGVDSVTYVYSVFCSDCLLGESLPGLDGQTNGV